MSGGLLVVVASAKGAPGVSTACVGLAATWPPGWRPVVVEVDPSGGDLAAWHGLPGEPGLVSLAAASRHTGRAGLVWDHVQEMPGGLPVVPAPAGAEQASAALDVLLGCSDLGFLTAPAPPPSEPPTAGLPDVEGTGCGDTGRGEPDMERAVVVADVGRLPARLSPAAGVGRLLVSADVVLLVAGSDVPGVVHAASAVNALTSLDERRSAGRVRLLLTGPGGYRAEEVADALGVPVECLLPDDPRTAAALAGRPTRGTVSVARSPLLRTLAGLAQALVGEQHAAPGTAGRIPATSGGDEHVPEAAPSRVAGRPELSAPGADLARGGWR